MSETPKRQGIVAALKARVFKADGWINALTGLGMATKDKRMGGTVQYARLSEIEVEDLYGADDVAAALVDTLPEDGLRQWFTFTGFEDAQGQAVEDELDRLQLAARLDVAWKWSRLYGGSAILMNVDDSLDLAQPLNVDQVRELKSLTVLSRWELTPATMDVDLNSPHYGCPLTYRLSPRRADTQGLGTEIHRSRLLRFDGVKLPLRLEIVNQYWGDSILGRTFNAIRNYNTSHDSAATILQEFNQGVFKIKGLADLLLSGNDEAVTKRLEMVNLSRSICRSVVIDQDETFDTIAAAVTGIPDMLRMVGQRLVVASRMPHTKILGESPSGLGATGQSEERNWYDYVSNQQELILRPKILELTTILLASRKGPTRGKAPEGWGFEFVPLWQMDETQQATNRKTQAETDNIYILAGVLDADEVAASRFGSGKYSSETTIDLEARKTEPTDPLADPATKPGTSKPGTGPGAGGDLANVQTQALNGAQVASLLETVGQVARGEIPRDAAIEVIMIAFQVDRPTAERVLASAGKGFKPADPKPDPTPFGGNLK